MKREGGGGGFLLGDTVKNEVLSAGIVRINRWHKRQTDFLIFDYISFKDWQYRILFQVWLSGDQGPFLASTEIHGYFFSADQIGTNHKYIVFTFFVAAVNSGPNVKV